MKEAPFINVHCGFCPVPTETLSQAIKLRAKPGFPLQNCPVTPADPILCPVAKHLILWTAGPLPFTTLSDTPSREELWPGKSGAHQIADTWHLQGHPFPPLSDRQETQAPVGKEVFTEGHTVCSHRTRVDGKRYLEFGEIQEAAGFCCTPRAEEILRPPPQFCGTPGVSDLPTHTQTPVTGHVGLLRITGLTKRLNPRRPVIINHLSNKGLLLGIKP